MNPHEWRRVLLRPWSLSTLAAVIALATLASVATNCAVFKPAMRPAPEVVVQLASQVDEVNLELPGSFVVRAPDGELIAEGRRLAPGRVRATERSELELNGVSLRHDEVRVRPRDADTPIQLGDRRYAGHLWLQATAGRQVVVRNVLDMETYVAGVLFSEMPASFPREALKAQAVAARSYARHKLRNGGKFLLPTDADQVYGGLGPEAALARSLVNDTRGEVLEFHGQSFSTFYSSTCGGGTASGREVFGEVDAPLAARRCSWCSASPLYRWQRTLDPQEVIQRMGLEPVAGGSLKLSARKDRFGRALSVTAAAGGQTQTLSGLKFRSTMNRDVKQLAQQLPSACFHEFRPREGEVMVAGAGYGHGVGLCQYGAAGLAKSGKSYRQILQYYYAGAELRQRW